MAHEKNKIRNKLLLNGLLKSFLTTLPIFVAFGVIALSSHPTSAVFSLSAFIAGFSGVIIAIRKEIPSSFRSIRGMPALITGIGVTVLCWVYSIILLLFGF